MSNRPNVLYILADDLGWADVGFHDSPIRTPSLDRLAAEGVEFTQHYVCPMCTPTRVSLLTGRYPGRFGVHATVPCNEQVLPDGYETLAGMLSRAGYATGLFGKWHLGSSPDCAPQQFGFDYSYGSLAGGVDPYNHCYKRGPFFRTWHRNGALGDEPGHVTDLITREAIAWIERQDGPWFCYVPYTAVHVPIKPTQDWLNRYVDEQYDNDPSRDRSFKKYAAYTSHMDACIGEMVECLARCDQLEDTIVVFSSDNGSISSAALHASDQYPGRQEEMPRVGSNLPYRGQKAQLYEGGIRTPTILSWPGTVAPGVVDEVVAVVDWMPTFSELLDAPPSSDPCWDGVSIWDVVSGGSDALERRLFWNFRGSQFAIRAGDWKLIKNDADEERVELFNISTDPYETREVADEHPEIVAKLSVLLQKERGKDAA